MSTLTATANSPATRLKVNCAGEPREMGRIQGETLRDKIIAARAALARLEAFRLDQPWWMPFGAYRWFAERTAHNVLAEPLARDFPALHERLAGIAAGAGLNLQSLYLMNALEPLLSRVRGGTVVPSLGACTAVAVSAARSGIGEPIVAKNFDYLPLVQPFYTMRESRPRDRLRSLDFTVAPLAGAIDGLNEAGLCITNNYAYTTDVAAPSGTISMVITEALERCATVGEAADWIKSRPRWGAGLLMLADAAGDMASLELSSTRASVRRPASGGDLLFHTNKFACPEMREVEVDKSAVFTDRAPKPLRGRRVQLSAETRDARLAELLGRAGPLGPDELATILSDHGPDHTPGDFTLCVHSAYWNTTACLQFLPKSRRVRVDFGNACQARYEDVVL